MTAKAAVTFVSAAFVIWDTVREGVAAVARTPDGRPDLQDAWSNR